MSCHRFEIDASAGPARERVIGGSRPLVRVRLFDGPGVVDTLTGEPADGEEVFTDLRLTAARELALKLLCCAEHAEQITQAAGWLWQR